ncbi:hypothetical protein CNYM01_09614 [Colletotrichum nymphaeae SA-01]|uniref:PWI domain-containing protein n=1 Tax=Colletotrichum nymphaeae SA-01 TaxID=1460502 RepID=A0A135TCR4_9PEZI|nr:hypothetical protein CNYM01_09614 [Colletotrichum nymphaeae SA-01]
MATGVDAKLLKSTKFPAEFNQKVDMQKVNLQPDIKALQIQLTGFLDKDTAPFCRELWKLFLSAQTSPQGVPKELLEAKKLELIQEKMEADRAADEARRRRGDIDRRQQDGPAPRDRDRGERGRGRGGGGDMWRGRNSDRDYDQRGRHGGRFGGNRSRSPAARNRDQRDRGSFRGSTRDSYVPRNRGLDSRVSGRRRNDTRSPSPASATSRSRSPDRKRDSSRGSPPAPARRTRRERSISSPRSTRNRSASPRRSQGKYRESRRKRRSSRSPSTPSTSPDKRAAAKRRRYSSSRSRSPGHHAAVALRVEPLGDVQVRDLEAVPDIATIVASLALRIPAVAEQQPIISTRLIARAGEAKERERARQKEAGDAIHSLAAWRSADDSKRRLPNFAQL